MDIALPDVRSHALVLAWLALVVTSVAQTAPAISPPPSSTAAAARSASDTPIELSPFEVRAEDDVGYQAGNTTSGSRLNSRLKDTPASVSAFTPEFLSDIAATNLEEMLGHATNVEIELADSTVGFDNPHGRSAEGNDYTFRMRGSAGGASRDFVDSSVPVDLYNVERAEVASGPNSILFGLGQAGGLVSLTGKKANLNRNRATLKSILGSWNYERYEGDYNRVLVPRTLAVRLLGVYQNAQGWRHWDFSDQARWTAAVAYQPFNNTTIYASFEKGHLDTSITIGWNAQDEVSGWWDAGKPIFDGTVAPPGTARFNNDQRYTYVQNDGRLYNYRAEFQSVNRYGAATLMSPHLAPYDVNIVGPGGFRHQNFTTRQLTVQQRLPKGIVAELAYFRNRTDVEANSIDLGSTSVRGDPNLTIPASLDATGSMANPYAGRLFLDSFWFKDRIVTANEIVRLSAAWEAGDSQRWFGRHRMAGLAENSQQDRLRRWRNEILVDENNVPIFNATNAEGAPNRIWRRHYLAEGDHRTYYSSNPSLPVPAFTLGGRTFHTTYASRARANTHAMKDIDSFMFAAQSFWWKDRVITTLGARRDAIRFKNAQEERVNDRNDPRVRSGLVSAGEWYFNGRYLEHKYHPTTFTAGAVVHATKRLSAFYNLSRNNGQPRFDRQVLPHGDVPEPTEGRGRDLGLMLDVFGDDRLFIRTTWYETMQLNDAPILPGGGALGTDNLTAMLTALRSAGKISTEDFDRQNITWTSATIDVLTEGVEVEVVANPTRNLTLRASYSHSNRRKQNFYTEVFEFFDARIPEWQRLLASNPAELATLNRAAQDLYDELNFQVDRQNTPFGSRPHKMNGTARFTFREGRLRGAFLGGSIRYQGKNFMSWDRATGHIYWGNESVLGDVFGGYRFRIPRARINATVQLNVRNVSDSYRANVGRYNTNYNGVYRLYLNEPRSYRLTTTLEF